MVDEKPTVVETLTLANKAREVITGGEWDQAGVKMVSITLPKEGDDGLAKAVMGELQRRVSGYTPRLDVGNDSITVTTKESFLAEARKAISRERN